MVQPKFHRPVLTKYYQPAHVIMCDVGVIFRARYNWNSHIGSLRTRVWALDQEFASTCATVYLVASFDFACSESAKRATSKATASFKAIILTEELSISKLDEVSINALSTEKLC